MLASNLIVMTIYLLFVRFLCFPIFFEVRKLTMGGARVEHGWSNAPPRVFYVDEKGAYMFFFGPRKKKRWSIVEQSGAYAPPCSLAWWPWVTCIFNVFKKLATLQSYINPDDVRHDLALNDGID